MIDLKKDQIIHRFDISLSKTYEEIKLEFEREKELDSNDDGQGVEKSNN